MRIMAVKISVLHVFTPRFIHTQQWDVAASPSKRHCLFPHPLNLNFLAYQRCQFQPRPQETLHTSSHSLIILRKLVQPSLVSGMGGKVQEGQPLAGQLPKCDRVHPRSTELPTQPQPTTDAWMCPAETLSCTLKSNTNHVCVYSANFWRFSSSQYNNSNPVTQHILFSNVLPPFDFYHRWM